MRPNDAAGRTSRRRFVARAAGLAAAAPLAAAPWARLLAQTACPGQPPGTLIRTLPLYGPGAQDAPLGRIVGGQGLDARLFTDLAGLTPERLTTPTDGVFVRTQAPPGLNLAPTAWRVRLGDTGAIAAAALAAEATPQGAHLIECAGNSNPQHFGLMSSVEWRGVPLLQAMQRLPRPERAWGVLVSGADPEVSRNERSIPGASWILPLADIAARQPFLATGMNGGPLTPNHGAPVRLVVPGWYGCAWIKWVNALAWVGEDAPSTPQMTEYAVRTHQEGRPALARDYQAPRIDTAAMPIRVEQRRVNGALVYDIVGIVWGGTAPVDQLVIRFGSRDRGVPVRVCPAPVSAATWALWTHRWRPAAPGYYDISLRTADPAVASRRLDLSFYIRRVRIDEV
ncbi:MAG: molybdopterin-dependent oxidoreductase [Vicinamibacterales bacterium]